jgi:AcrR family transcriptional regulator
MLDTVTDQLDRQPAEQDAPRTHRRRGEELEAALLDAAWDELAEVGFPKLTMESVAARAKTGVAVLYRRWHRKDDLVMDAIAHYGRQHPVDIPDTGSLRGDMLATLSKIGEGRLTFTTVVRAAFSGLLADTGLSPAEVRARLVSDRPLWSTQVYRRAQERGEIDLRSIPEAVLAMPFDLMRHDFLMTLKPIPRERILAIVDDLFLPLVQCRLSDTITTPHQPLRARERRTRATSAS